jgi:nitroimidazol reductase NimA-like FMN-containing flavoprotein (pyridoxamine 5'-phosphate oxidase superfamily)
LTKALASPQVLQDLFASQRSAVLATTEGGQPYLSLMAFVASDDLKFLVIATPRATRKYRNLMTDPRVALLVDNRTNQPRDVEQALAVTALGVAEECAPAEIEHFLSLYRSKHPHLEEFATSPENVLIKVKVDRYYLVSRFQEVREYSPAP